MPFIQVDTHSLPFKLRRSLRTKRLHMAYRDGEFEIVAPVKRIKNTEILQFIKSHLGWMLKQIKHSAKTPTMSAWPENFLAQEEILFREKKLKLNVKFGLHNQAELVQDTLRVMVPWHKITQETLELTIKKQVIAFYQLQARQAVEAALAHYCPQIGRWPREVQIKQQKTRWGSCGPTDKININWLLILAPIGVLEYVVVHELCHLFHRNHGVRFWTKVEKTMPHYQQYEKWLSRHGKALIKC